MDTTRKLIVGFFVGGCLLLFGVGLFLIGSSSQMFSKAFEVYAEFAKITGIQNGGKVRVAGMDAGTVTRIDVPLRPDGKFRVHFRIVEKLHPLVRRDSIVTIQTDGLLGNKFLQIEAGTMDSPPAADQSLIPSKEPFDWGDLMDQMNGVVLQVNGILGTVKEQLVSTLTQVETTVKSANTMIQGATPNVKSILVSSDRIAVDLRQIIDGIEKGEGTIGALVKDKELYASIKRSAAHGETAAANVSETTANVKRVTKKLDESDIVPEVQKTVKHLQEIAAQVKAAVEKFQSASGEGGVAENLQRTLANANEAMSDLSDDTEALKHNFFFRGFFNRRGFFDLGSLTAPEYRDAKFGKGFKKERIWLADSALFTTDASGAEVLSAAGKAALDDAMTALLRHPRNGPLIVEGFSAAGTASQQYLNGRRRAVRVQTYLIARFHLRPAYTGVVALDSNSASPDGVAIVTFYK